MKYFNSFFASIVYPLLFSLFFAVLFTACGDTTGPPQPAVEVIALYWPNGTPIAEDEVGNLEARGHDCILQKIVDQANYQIRTYLCYPPR